VDIHTLRIIWFGLVAVLWVGYLALEGFDFGVGMLLPVLGRNDTERRVLINTIGPVWDGNEVWLLTAGGATFAAFPLWYANLFSAFYLPLFLILVGLILRGVAFEYRGKVDDATWRARWDRAIIGGSALVSLLLGVAVGNFVHGVAAGDVVPQLASPYVFLLHALNPYSLLTGVTVVLLFLTHGALYLSLKTTDELQARSSALAATLSIALLGVAAVWAIWTQLAYGKAWTWGAVTVAALALVGIVWTARGGRQGTAFSLSTLVTALAVVIVFGSMFPNVIPVNGLPDGAAQPLTIDTASSSQHTLTVMTLVAVVMVPIVLGYTTWAYWTFRHRVSVSSIPVAAGLKRVTA